MRLFTWGYQSRSIDDLIKLCRKHSIATVVDVRRYPSSSQPGWGLYSIKGELEDVGISYMHLAGLGNYGPGLPWNRADSLTVKAAVGRVRTAFSRGEVLLLCRERNAEECHRSEVAKEVEKICRCDVFNLGQPLNVFKKPDQLSLF